MNKVQIIGAVTILVIACGAFLFKDEIGGNGYSRSTSGDHSPATSYSDDPGLKGLKIPSSN